MISVSQKPVLVLNGPNLNMLGTREPEIYGSATLHDVEDICIKTAERFGLVAECKQSNNEGELISWIQQAKTVNSAIIINAGAYTHTSIAILDALTLTSLPVVEVHISNIHSREEFRHNSFISKVAKAVICGCGIDGYAYAMQTAAKLVGKG